VRPRTLLVVSAHMDEAGREAVAAGRWPRKDYYELAAALEADVIDYGFVAGRRPWRWLRRLLGTHLTQAVAAFSRSGAYDCIFADGEHTGLPLAVLLRLKHRYPRLVTIGHLLTTPTKRAVMRWLRPQTRLETVIVHARGQKHLARVQLGLADGQLAAMPYQVDQRFWRRDGERQPDGEPVICSVGLEYRDYPALISAVRALPVRVVIAAASHWSRHRSTAEDAHTPSNVAVTSLDYGALRDLYSRARFVVVPLQEVENQAGITVILEAMAMGKAVIVSATRGQRDVVRGRLCTAMGLSPALLGGPAVFGVSRDLAEAETGLYVPPGDAAALRRAIQYLLAHPEEAARMGAAGRRVIEECMNLDRFVERIVDLVRGADATSPSRSPGGATAAATPAVV
jgi:glycosyltransferase involved in cell wall biosynthesis